VQFLNAAGNAMFKVFVRRDKQRELLVEQVALFEALRKASVQ
jgi:putative heme iron utilization protein